MSEHESARARRVEIEIQTLVLDGLPVTETTGEHFATHFSRCLSGLLAETPEITPRSVTQALAHAASQTLGETGADGRSA